MEMLDESIVWSEEPIERPPESDFNNALGGALQIAATRWQSAARKVILVEKANVLSGIDDDEVVPDILIVDQGMAPVAIECSYDPAVADKDAIARLGARPAGVSLDIKTAISVHIPEKYQSVVRAFDVEAMVNTDQLFYAVHQLVLNKSQDSETHWVLRRWPEHGFLGGTVGDLWSFMLAVALPQEELDQISTDVADTIKNVSQVLQRFMPSEAVHRLSHLVLQRSQPASLRTGMLLWLIALLTHSRLCQIGFADLKTLKEHVLTNDRIDIGELLNGWRKTLDTNWRSTLKPAIDVLGIFTANEADLASIALHELVRCVEKIEGSGVGSHINIVAELFPKLREDRKEAAALCTQAASAELLACLTITPESLTESDWVSPDFFKSHILADLACGTGTLLKSGFRRIRDLHEQFAYSASNTEKLQIDAFESGLIGTDISPIAAHLTATSLVLSVRNATYSKSRIGWIEVGREDSATGSLEYFLRDNTLDLRSSFSRDLPTQSDIDTQKSVAIANESVDWILMNPPYSAKYGGRHTFDVVGLSKSDRKACQERWGQLIKNTPANRSAGLAASFLELARRKVKQGGRIGFVLPITASYAESWRDIRKMIETEFEDVIAIAIASGKEHADSAKSVDTDLVEMLLVATKRSLSVSRSVIEDTQSNIVFLTLRKSVSRCGEAAEIARATLNGYRNLQLDEQRSVALQLGDVDFGAMYKWQGNCRGDAWLALGTVNAELEHAATRLLEGVIDFAETVERLPVSMTSIEQAFEVGPTHNLIGHLRDEEPRGAFELLKIRDLLGVHGLNRSVWHADSTTQTSLLVRPTHKGFESRYATANQIKYVQQTTSTLLYARSMSWTSQALLAASTQYACLGGRSWVTLSKSNEVVLNVMALWANSTFGLLLHWTQTRKTRYGCANTQAGAMKRIVCPNFGRLDDKALLCASNQFHALKTKTLLPACQAHIDTTRIAIDEVVFDLFDLSENARTAMRALRELWCHEPSVHGWNQAAVAKLRDVS